MNEDDLVTQLRSIPLRRASQTLHQRLRTTLADASTQRPHPYRWLAQALAAGVALMLLTLVERAASSPSRGLIASTRVEEVPLQETGLSLDRTAGYYLRAASTGMEGLASVLDAEALRNPFPHHPIGEAP